MKTNIRLRVTPKQSEGVQKICFANNIGWGNELELNFLDAPCLFIDHRWLSYSHDIKFYNEQEEEEVDADLFIRTNGTCEEFTCEHPGVDNTTGKCITCGKHIDKSDFEPNIQSSSSVNLKSECQFAKYGFEKPDFECEILGTVSGPFEKDDFVVGVIKKGMFNNCPHMWSVKYGTCYTSSLASNMIEYDLKPIKKPWYETCKFPCLITADSCMPVVVHYFKNGYVYDYRDNKYCITSWRLLTNDEIEELKQ